MPLFPTRRWLRYSLSTLLIAITIFCMWLGYHVNWRRQRFAILKHYDADTNPHYLHRYGPPIGLRLAGEYGYSAVIVDTVVTDEEFDRIAGLFPEADIWCGTVSDPYRLLERPKPKGVASKPQSSKELLEIDEEQRRLQGKSW